VQRAKAVRAALGHAEALDDACMMHRIEIQQRARTRRAAGDPEADGAVDDRVRRREALEHLRDAEREGDALADDDLRGGYRVEARRDHDGAAGVEERRREDVEAAGMEQRRVDGADVARVDLPRSLRARRVRGDALLAEER